MSFSKFRIFAQTLININNNNNQIVGLLFLLIQERKGI